MPYINRAALKRRRGERVKKTEERDRGKNPKQDKHK